MPRPRSDPGAVTERSDERGAGTRTITSLALTMVLLGGGCASQGVSSPGSTPATSPALTPGATSPSPSPSATSEIALTPFGPLPTAGLDASRSAALQAVLDAAVRDGAPDAIAAVVTADGTWAGAAGIGGPEGRAATAEDEFAIASVTKMFTATLIMRLAEQGKIDLDAPLASYLGDLDVDANGATVRQALEMMAGFADDEQPAAMNAIHEDAAHVWTPAELVARYLPPPAAPGTSYRYSSPGYAMLGFAAENVTGTSLAAAMRAELLDPVGASRIAAQGPGVATPTPWALPIDRYLGTWRAEDMGVGGVISCMSSATYGPGAGSIASDAPSLAAWTWHLFAGDVVGASSLAAMLPGSSGHGMGIERVRDVGRPAIGAAGSKTGYGTIMAVDPTEQAIVVLFVNDPDFIVERYVTALFDASGGG